MNTKTTYNVPIIEYSVTDFKVIKEYYSISAVVKELKTISFATVRSNITNNKPMKWRLFLKKNSWT